MKISRIISLGLFFSLSASWLPPMTRAESGFLDIHNHKYKESILFLAERGVIHGYTPTEFKPNTPIKRGEMLKIVMESLSDEPTADLQNCFEDVTNQWFAKYVCAAKEKNIVKGYDTGLYEPGKEVNMAEGLKIGMETFGSAPQSISGREWYVPYVEQAHQQSLFSKYSYFPSRSMTRGEMSFLVHQLILNKEGARKLSSTSHFWSKGCGVNPPSTPPNQSVVNGVPRSYITVIPQNYQKEQATKLIFAFHGRTNSNSMVRGYYKVEEASAGQAIIVYPSGLPTDTSPRNWANGGDKASQLRDYAFFDQLLQEFSNNYCIDLDEVYIVGHSLGAWFTNSLACFRGDVIRAVGTLGGGTSIGECTGPVAAMIWHNPKDNLASFSSGVQARDQYLRQNRCSNVSVATSPAEGNCVQYQGCHDDAPVIWCPHTIDTDYRGGYYPHTWPNPTGPAIWSFFESLKD